MYNQDFVNNLANSSIDVNVYRKKDPEQQYGGFGYAMNNLMRGIGSNNIFPGGNMNPINGLFRVALPFTADMIWGNKYKEVE